MINEYLTEIIMKIKYISSTLSMLLIGCLLTTSCSDDDNVNVNTTPIISSVETGEASVTAVSATMTGKILDLSSQSTSAYSAGIKISTSESDVQSGTVVAATLNADGSFSVEKTGLAKNVVYYYTTYVTLQNSISYYGDVKSFVTTDAKVTTMDADGVTSNKATVGGTLANVSELPSDATVSCGVLVSQSRSDEDILAGKDLTFEDISSACAGTAFSLSQQDLLPNTKYYYKAYMKLNDGHIMGQLDSLTTSDFETEYVDLGLSVIWAKTNIGASAITETGGLYGYGDATGLKITSDGAYSTTDASGTSDDICMASGTGGRLPSVSEMKEMLTQCTITDATVDGVQGYNVLGPSGNSIFIPKSGYRDGNDVTDGGIGTYLWTGSIDNNDNTRAYAGNVGSHSFSTNLTAQGLSIRAVKQTKVNYDNSKLIVGTNGDDARLEIYNAYGNTASNSGIDNASFMFTKNMYVTFSVFGTGATKENPITATIGFASGDWGVQDWATSVTITGDGAYTIPVTTTSTSKGIMVYVIDLKGQAANVANIEGYINSIIVDTDAPGNYPAMNSEIIDQDKILKGDIENKGNYRMEIYNQWGSGSANDPSFDPSILTFSSRIRVQFEISGIGTLANPCRADLIYADNSWGVSNWGETSGSVNVTGDGTYSVYLDTNGVTAVALPSVFCVDIVGLKSEANLDNVKCIVTDIAFK